MASAKITQRILDPDVVEVVRDRIAEVLAVESLNQQQLATDASEDPDLWKLRLFVARSAPWEEFRDAATAHLPIVNVCWENSQDDEKASDTVQRQRVHAVYNIDCYASAIASETETGHQPADELAEFRVARAARLVRRILMSAHYTYLDMRGVVTGRWRQSAQAFQPPIDANPTKRIAATRLAFRYSFNEWSPQVQGVLLELMTVTAINAATGEVFFQADHPIEEP